MYNASINWYRGENEKSIYYYQRAGRILEMALPAHLTSEL
ncbi:hypothetical protein SpAn4DRAFT_0312 [Sporomusa ovata]|uniref:Uncharacterized protein n=1 Tax=Sporomusa ovata TaxID=2378 RepID=A0A0U1L2F3_9FIRM|nr:hypothetical protein SpAn4DRAFT_0312 [Sporomusa ovata]